MVENSAGQIIANGDVLDYLSGDHAAESQTGPYQYNPVQWRDRQHTADPADDNIGAVSTSLTPQVQRSRRYSFHEKT